jgi:DNA invertase Pin-like site-specific DNA recombinase
MELTVPQQIPTTPKVAPIRWCLYARKSSEQDERQALSIEQQIKEMELLADHWGIDIAEVRKESHSSKESGTRPVYNRLIKDIQLGYFNGIVTWAPDRLSRNAGDLGILVDLMDQGKLTEIRTHGQTFTTKPRTAGDPVKLQLDTLIMGLAKKR